MSFIYDLSDIWNASGTAFTAIKMNVNNSASASGSKLIDLQISSASKFYVDKSGTGYFANDIGVGVASSSWDSAFSAIDLGNYGSVWNSSGGTIGFSHNAYHNGTNYIYKQTAAAASYQQASGIHSWHIAASGTAGAVISFTQAMTLNASGNVGIGTSSPSTKLDVASAAGSTTAYTALFRSTNTNGYSGLIGIGVAPATAGAYTAAAFAAENSNGTANDGGRLKFYTAADDASHTLTERMRIDSSGNVGIGTSSPYSRFTVVPSSTPTTVAGANQITVGESTANSAYRLQIGYLNNGAGGYNGSIQVYDNGNAQSLILNGAGGNVGIGTSSPAAKLDVATSAGRMLFTYNSTANFISSVNAANSAYVDLQINGATTQFYTGGTERARIDSSGNLLVGTTDSGATSGTGVKFRPGQGSSVANVDSRSDGSSVGFSQYSTGAGAYRFYVAWNGQISATVTSISAISDQTLKENIRDLETGLSEVMALRPRRFDWKPETKIDEKNVAGFIAQEVEEVLPELVYDYQYNDGETKKSVKMGDILPTLVKAMQEQQVLINDLTARVAELEGK